MASGQYWPSRAACSGCDSTTTDGMRPPSKSRVPGDRPKTPGSWFLVPGSWFLVPGSWFLVPGSWFLVPGSWFVFIVSDAVGDHDERGDQAMEFAAVAGGYREVEGRPGGLLPGDCEGAGVVEEAADAMGERRRLGPGEDGLDPGVGLEDRQHVEQPGHRRDIVNDRENSAGVAQGRPAPGARPDGQRRPVLLSRGLISVLDWCRRR
jgi:hypothetical protein